MTRTSKRSRKITALQNLYGARIKERLREEEVCQQGNKENEGPLEEIFPSSHNAQSKKKLKWEDMILKNIRAKEAKAKLLAEHGISKSKAGPSRQALRTVSHNGNSPYDIGRGIPTKNSTETQSAGFGSSESLFPPNAPQQPCSNSQPNTSPPTIIYGAQFITFPVAEPPQPISPPSPVIEPPSPTPNNDPTPPPPPKTRQAALVELAAQIRIATAICEALSQKANTATQEASIAESLAMTTAGMVAALPIDPYREAARMAAQKAYEAKFRMEKLKEQEAEARGILQGLVGQYNEAKPVGGRGRPGPGRKR